MADSAGIDRTTGRVLTDLDHVRQSFLVILTTRIGSRVMARTFGSKVPQLLGRNLVESTLIRFFAALVYAVRLWEPRLEITNILYPAPPNSAATFRFGKLSVVIVANYRPHALEGDTTSDVSQIYL